MSLFRQSSRLANEIHLLGVLTEEEFKSGIISPKRLAQIKLEIGRYRVIEKGASILGSTPEGQIITQYKRWAIPIFRTTLKNFSSVGKILKNKGAKTALTSKELRELARAAEITTGVILLGSKFIDEKDDSFIGKLTRRLYVEALTILGALDTKMMLSVPRLAAWLENVGEAIHNLILLEEYKTKEGYKGTTELKRELVPRAVSQFTKKTAKPKTKRRKLKFK